MRNTKKVLLAKMQDAIERGDYTASVYSYGVWGRGLIMCIELRVMVDGEQVTKYPLFSAAGYGRLHDEPREYDGRMFEKHKPYYARVLNIINDGETLARYISF